MHTNSSLSWQFKSFLELHTTELYQILALRQAVFVVEQRECYLDADSKDLDACHLLGINNHQLIAYARILFPPHHAVLSFGRIIVEKTHRGKGLAKLLIQQILKYLKQSAYADLPIQISAQAYLIDFYQQFGFKPIGEIYIDGKIAHRNMLLSFLS